MHKLKFLRKWIGGTPLYLCFFLLLCVFVLPPHVWAQSSGGFSNSKGNEEAVEKLRKMSPQEIQNLDSLLSQALTLYYDRKFALALPIFKELAGKVETMDIMFWLGTSAAQVGETRLAIEKYQKMLAIDPGLHRVRLELAAVYFATGQDADARRELQIVRDAKPPATVLDNISKMLAAIDERSRKVFWNVRLSTGYMWDDNVTTGPDTGIYSLPGGGSFEPSPTAAKLSDQASVTSFSGNLLFDPGERQGFMWNTAASGYLKAYRDYSEFNYTALDFNTGPWWSGRQSVFKLPVGYTYTEYGSDRLSYIFHVDPSYEYFFNRYFSLKGSYSLKNERFYEDFRADTLNNTSHIAELAPTLYLGNRRHILSASLGYDYHDAKDDAYTYKAPILGISYFTRFPTQTELFLGYQWTQRKYDETLWPYIGYDRKDQRHYFTGVVSQKLFKYFNLSYAFTYTDNDSNLGLYSWDRMTHTVSLGFQF